MQASDLLSVCDLRVSFHTHAGTIHAVRGVNFTIAPGEVVGLVGESGCGKSVTAHSLLGLINRPPGNIDSGEIWFNGEDLLKKSERQLQDVRGNQIGMIFQDPMTSLNPTMRVGRQILEAIHRHKTLSNSEARQIAIDTLEAVGIPQAATRFHQYPHEFSGGMRQRVMIAIALVCNPALLIADEPTTALDVTIQAQILDLIRSLRESRGMAVLLITHDLGVVAGLCDRIIVMYAGEVMETGSVDQIFYAPKHPYTKSLLQAIPRAGQERHKRLVPILGAPPNLLHATSGCPFTPRCRWAMEVCCNNTPPLLSIGTQQSACWLHHEYAKQHLEAFETDKEVCNNSMHTS